MNLVGKLTAISIQITGLAIAIAIPAYKTVAQVQQVTQALSPEQINLRAKQITVRIDGTGTGSGAIINKSENIYTVLTNWHVVKNPGQYIVQTIDGRPHDVNYTDIQKLAELDLALIKFSSNQNYQVADLGNSAQLIEGQNIYFAGYPGELRQEDNRYYRFFPANLVGILPQSTQNGYSLIYNGEAFPGMSGGPVLNRDALLIGIHGEANIHALTGAISNYAIPIDSYKLAIANTTPNNTPNNSLADVPQQPSPNESNSPVENQLAPPEITVETNEQNTQNTTLSSIDTETNSDARPENNQNSESVQSTSATNNESSETDSPSSQPEVETDEATESVAKKDESSESVQSTSATDNESSETDSSSPQPEVETDEATESVAKKNESSESATSRNSQPSDSVASETSELISLQTGIDYTNLKNLLSNQKWEEADRQTNYLIKEIIKIAKRTHPHTFIELKPLTDFACNDINTIDQLWQEYSEGNFGFAPQQQIWLTVNEYGDFSTETWRNFATLVGWKQGDIASSSGYLLYEQLTFDPQKAPIGHLPWWFASSQEQQNLIKHVFNRCHFDTFDNTEQKEAR